MTCDLLLSEKVRYAVVGGRLLRGRGFALLVMLGLLGLVASALVALTALVAQEAALQSLQVARWQAKQNAQLALLEAVGVLQRQAGRDGVATARASLLGVDADSGAARAAPHALAWTGVWRAGQSSEEPIWLVSGIGRPAQPLLAEHSAILVAERHTDGGAGLGSPLWEAVRAPLVVFDGGAYAWWVGDEGVKVNIGAPYGNSSQAQAWLRKEASQVEAEAIARLLAGPSVNMVLPQTEVATVAASGAGQGVVIGRAMAAALEADDGQDAQVRARILDIADLAQIAEGRPDAARGYQSDLFHEVTFVSHGVLADPQTGLRADYSQAPQRFPLGGEFAQYTDWASAMEPPAASQSERTKFIPTQADLRRRYRMRPPSGALAKGDVSAAIAPILTDCYLVFNVHKVDDKDIENLDRNDPNRPSQAQRNRVMIHAGLLVELWNPYTSALVPQDLLLEVEGLPERVLMHPQATGAPVIQVPFAASLRNGPTHSKSWWVELPFTDKEHPGTEPSWLPGRVYNWTGPNNYMDGSGSERGRGATVGNFFHRDLNQSAWAQLTSVLYPMPSNGRAPDFRVQLPQPTRLTIRLRLKPQSPAQWADAPVIAQIDNLVFEPMTASAPLDAQTLVYQFGFRVRLEDPGTLGGAGSAWEKSRWLRRADPRSTLYAGTTLGTGAAVGNVSYYTPSRQPRDYVQSTGKGFLGSNSPAELWNRPMGASGLLQAEDAPLFELPRQQLLRVADLRHLHLHGLRPYGIGNRWGAGEGNDVNRVFDLGFFSGVGGDGASPVLFAGEALPNERLLSAVEYADLRTAGGDAAAHLLMHGAFNINTTSPIAWRAVLAGALYGDFEYIHSDPRDGEFSLRAPTQSVRLGRAVARYAQSAAETFDAGDMSQSRYLQAGALHDPSVEPPSAYFRRGLTPLSPEQLDLLAHSVSRRIALRAKEGLPPFGSFAEFLGPQRLESFRHPQESGAYMSVLEAAVYDAMADTSLPLKQRLNRDDNGNIIWWDTPSFITGGDLWAQFAHYAAVRSDTFRVRAYGRSKNSSGDLLAQAWCEAVVQRLPQLHGQPPPELTAQGAALLRDGNSGFGRQFKIISLRWLREDEL